MDTLLSVGLFKKRTQTKTDKAESTALRRTSKRSPNAAFNLMTKNIDYKISSCMCSQISYVLKLKIKHTQRDYTIYITY